MRSASGVFLALYGFHSFFPLSGQSKKQTAVSRSTVEADIVTAGHAIRTSGLPPVQIDLFQDSQATAKSMSRGRAPTLRHIKGTHSVSVAWINERVLSADLNLYDCVSNVMAADIFTIQYINRETWVSACS